MVTHAHVFIGYHNTFFSMAGASQNARVENAIRSKMQGWKMQE